jgi:hypothetical protein
MKLKVGIVFDPWKVSIFRRHFNAAKIEYSPLGGIPEGTSGFCVEVEPDQLKLVENVTRAANTEAASTNRGSPSAN